MGLRSAAQGAWSVLWVVLHADDATPWKLYVTQPPSTRAYISPTPALNLVATFSQVDVETLPIQGTQADSHVYAVFFKPTSAGALQVRSAGGVL
jgi:hypothetical protein